MPTLRQYFDELSRRRKELAEAQAGGWDGLQDCRESVAEAEHVLLEVIQSNAGRLLAAAGDIELDAGKLDHFYIDAVSYAQAMAADKDDAPAPASPASASPAPAPIVPGSRV